MNTEQEKFWQGEFGNNYIDRNDSSQLIASNTAMFAKVIENIGSLNSVLELGCNIGLNLKALRQLSSCELTGVEINNEAVTQLKQWNDAHVVEASILDIEFDKRFDLTFTKGVLIHINPDFLTDVYRRLYEFSRRYVLVAEYYNPTPVSISYHGHGDRLFKRDFAGDLMKMYSNLQLLDYGFIYHGDIAFPQDDITWFLLEKR